MVFIGYILTNRKTGERGSHIFLTHEAALRAMERRELIGYFAESVFVRD
jgi:hypothetical protein